jgi:hypothetical protein
LRAAAERVIVGRGSDAMGLSFQVGSAEQVILEPAASRFVARLASSYPASRAGANSREAWCSTELAWSGWSALQGRVASTLGETRAPHLLSMEAWFGAYLPTELEPGANLPVDEAGLKALEAKYDDDELCDEDMDVQTYAQLLLGARMAQSRNQPLWVIK